MIINMTATGQEMVRENWHFEEKSGKIEIVRLNNTIEGQKKHFGSNGCKGLL